MARMNWDRVRIETQGRRYGWKRAAETYAPSKKKKKKKRSKKAARTITNHTSKGHSPTTVRFRSGSCYRKKAEAACARATNARSGGSESCAKGGT